jgi:hypothetical protein
MKKHKGTPRTIQSRVLNERRTVYEIRDDENDLIAIVDGRDDINWEAMNGNPNLWEYRVISKTKEDLLLDPKYKDYEWQLERNSRAWIVDIFINIRR